MRGAPLFSSLKTLSAARADPLSEKPFTIARGSEVCSTKAHSRGIDSGERGQVFGRGVGGKLGGHSCHPRKVEAPHALCAEDHPCPGASPRLAQPAERKTISAGAAGGSCIMRVKYFSARSERRIRRYSSLPACNSTPASRDAPSRQDSRHTCPAARRA